MKQIVEHHIQDQLNNLGNKCQKCGSIRIKTYLEIDGFAPYRGIDMLEPVTVRYFNFIYCPKCEK